MRPQWLKRIIRQGEEVEMAGVDQEGPCQCKNGGICRSAFRNFNIFSVIRSN